ncbi:MAG: flippase-like domain-containing protein [Gemmatimonadota bacterium]|nr:MAG: flippase-like domain-containing protein [Gemmatimonadota bacterium]
MSKWLTLVLSIVIMFVLLKLADFKTVWSTWQMVRLDYALAAGGLLSSTILARVFAWQYLLRRAQESITFFRLLPLLIIAFFSGIALPVRSGELVGPWIVSTSAKLPFGKVVAILFCERIAHMLVLFIIMTCSTLINLDLLLGSQKRLYPLAWILFALALGVILWMKRGWIIGKIRQKLLSFEKTSHHVDLFLETVTALSRTGSHMAMLFILSFLFWGCVILAYHLLLRSLDMNLNLSQTAFVSSLSTLAGTFMVIPVGPTEGIASSLLIQFGYSYPVSISFASFYTMMWVGLLGSYTLFSYGVLSLMGKRI